jgi:hypothetical protein
MDQAPVAALLTSLALMACGGGGGGGGGSDAPAQANDSIQVTSVSPPAAVPGAPTDFTVDFTYRLASVDNGIIYLGFNTSDPHSYIMSPSTLTVTRGSGSGSLTASASPVEYPPPDSFVAYVNLSENPHPSTWTPLSNDTAPIAVGQNYGMSPAAVTSSATDKRQGMSVSGWSCGGGPIGSCAMLLP